jgi:lysozyme family protein
MAASSYDEALRRLLAHEGGYTNHPSDPGGPTNFGITIYDYQKYVKPGATAADVRAMKLAEAKSIYRAKYWDSQRCTDLPAGVDDSIFDYGVNSGIGRSGKVLRRVCGLPASSSIVNDQVLVAVAKRDPAALIAAINDERLLFLKGLKTWSVFGTGWARRVKEVKAFSLYLHETAAALPVERTRMQPLITPAESDTDAAKGMVPAPAALKKLIVAGGGGAGGSPLTYWDWAMAHPYETGAIVLAGVVIVGGGLYALNRWHQLQQEAPTPGLVPVPLAAA